MRSTELVSVVIPAYNASATIDETLRSVRAQTHAYLEIIVVDDGSKDDTLDIARRHAAMDPRIRVLSQANAGVAAARNFGWKSAHADLIAFVDADDLWAPTKIERQLHALLGGGKRVGLVYAWYQLIDGESRVLQPGGKPLFEGDVLDDIFCGNFIGNGSAVLVRRQVLIDTQGFESSLRAADAQGCEDLLFYCRAAERHHFAVIPDYLIGYRTLPDNMSSNLPRMLRSWMLVMDEMETRHADRHATLATGLRHYGAWLLFKALRTGRLDYFREVLSLLAGRDKGIALVAFWLDLPGWCVNAVRWRVQASLGRLRRPVKPPVASFPVEEPRQWA
ncbi:glycosyltransferase family 2 protein [Sphingomonas sp. PR090111-T3T-6A]|uniref:glycosyltransferase family 2 protein n=1 Tax=Sphingomonas sp. PR090111-T3T-6A TaxID=685778 RepID=UPI00036C7C18|nr:glycosyltransferase family A protein [Sphingomonas sp. PR090111-T3T-6A]